MGLSPWEARRGRSIDSLIHSLEVIGWKKGVSERRRNYGKRNKRFRQSPLP